MGDHPRIRGEHDIPFQIHPNQHGSSPHTRGAPAPGFSIRPGAGIIPAYAGSTLLRLRRRIDGRDHPRIRGEHSSSPSKYLRPGGSSPHTRGAHTAYTIIKSMDSDHPRIRGEHVSKCGFCVLPGWIIPAYAGSTCATVLLTLASRDHPRIRGEHTLRLL